MKLQRYGGNRVGIAGSHIPIWRFPVPSLSKPGVTYEVANKGNDWFCTCQANKFAVECSHIKKIKDELNRKNEDTFDPDKPVDFEP